MILTILLSFFAGAATVIFFELLALDALLDPLRDLIGVLIPGG